MSKPSKRLEEIRSSEYLKAIAYKLDEINKWQKAQGVIIFHRDILEKLDEISKKLDKE